jgi:hypothetical protein
MSQPQPAIRNISDTAHWAAVYRARESERPAEVRSLLQAAAQLRRLTLFLRLMSLLPDSTGRQGSRPWSGVCLMARQGS